MKKLLFILVLLISSCSCTTLPPKGTIDPEFISYLVEFNKQAHIYGQDYKAELTDVRISFSILSNQETQNHGRVIGTCYFEDNLIKIDKLMWEYSPHAIREVLLFHELGHCILQREHREGMSYNIKSGMLINISIMNPEILPLPMYVLNRQYYMMELFTYKGAQIGAFN